MNPILDAFTLPGVVEWGEIHVGNAPYKGCMGKAAHQPDTTMCVAAKRGEIESAQRGSRTSLLVHASFEPIHNDVHLLT